LTGGDRNAIIYYGLIGDRRMCKGIPQNKRYEGKYVATASFNSKKVIASGNDAGMVYDRAIEKGCKRPIVMYVPDSKMICIL
jgi:hypothetical protein